MAQVNFLSNPGNVRTHRVSKRTDALPFARGCAPARHTAAMWALSSPVPPSVTRSTRASGRVRRATTQQPHGAGTRAPIVRGVQPMFAAKPSTPHRTSRFPALQVRDGVARLAHPTPELSDRHRPAELSEQKELDEPHFLDLEAEAERAAAHAAAITDGAIREASRLEARRRAERDAHPATQGANGDRQADGGGDAYGSVTNASTVLQEGVVDGTDEAAEVQTGPRSYALDPDALDPASRDAVIRQRANVMRIRRPER